MSETRGRFAVDALPETKPESTDPLVLGEDDREDLSVREPSAMLKEGCCVAAGEEGQYRLQKGQVDPE